MNAADRAPGRGDEWDFFVSYTQADRGWAEWIAWLLEEARYRVLVQAWDMVPGSNWIDRMGEGVLAAERTVALLSAEYLSSVYGTAEWQGAWRGDPLGDERKLIPIRVRECSWPAGLLGHVVGIDLVGLGEAAARQRLLEGIETAALGRAKPAERPPFPPAMRAVPAEPRFPDAIPLVWNVPPRNPNFSGRDDELARIRGGFDATANRIGAAVTVQVVHGMGGVGKTQTTVEYVYRHAADYDLCWWIRAGQPTLLAAQLAALGVALGLPPILDPQAAVQAVHAELRRRRRWLMIFDGVETVSDLRLLVPQGAGHVLISTRRAGFGFLGSVLDLEVLSRDAAIALLRRRVPGLTDAEADSLADQLGDLPLALEQATGYLDQTGIPPEDYLTLLRTRADEMHSRGQVPDSEHTIATAWSLSLDRLLAESPAAVVLLGLCAYLAAEPIPPNLFTKRPELLPEPLNIAAADPLTFSETIGTLVDYSLARRTNAGLLVHRLVQAVTRTHLGRQDLLSAALGLLHAELPAETGTPENWPAWRQFLPHVLAVTAHVDDTHSTSAEAISWLLDRAAVYQRGLGCQRSRISPSVRG